MPATNPVTLSSSDIREIGEALYGAAWQGEMAKALGVPRQSVAYYLKSGGVKGTQTAAIIGLVARVVTRDAKAAKDQQDTVDHRRARLLELLGRIDPN